VSHPVGPYIITLMGVRFPFSDPQPHHIRIEDIVTGLGTVNRYSGQRVQPLSVAAHSIIVTKLLPRDAVEADPLLPLAALLHDASEAYMSDIPGPLKSLLPDYQKIERRVMNAVADRFGLPREIFNHPALRWADKEAMRLERGAEEASMRQTIAEWEGEPELAAVVDMVRSRASLPEEWGFDEWPTAEVVVNTAHGMVIDPAAQAADNIRVRFVLAFEAEARRLESKAPTAAVRLSEMLAEAGRHTQMFARSKGAQFRVMALMQTVATLPAVLVKPAMNAAIALAQVAAEDPPATERNLVARGVHGMICAAAGSIAAGVEGDERNAPDLNRMDPAIRREDPARALNEVGEILHSEPEPPRQAAQERARGASMGGGSRSVH
jgi:uncharacterized protein